MTSPAAPFLFISYRREDSAAAAGYLLEMVGRMFGLEHVFLDVDAIEGGEDWATRIRTQLEQATVVISIIGAYWLKVTDRYGLLRIHKQDDWVRRELEYALSHSCTVVPVLLLETPLPDKEALPESLSPLLRCQTMRLRDDCWHDDLVRLIHRIEKLGFTRRTAPAVNYRYPTPKVNVRELAARELNDALDSLPGWSAGSNERGGSELTKSYEFASFKEAMAFMTAASEHICREQHHPRWENLWRTVSVRLSTWDIGSRISPLDVELAHHLDKVRATFRPAQIAEQE